MPHSENIWNYSCRTWKKQVSGVNFHGFFKYFCLKNCDLNFRIGNTYMTISFAFMEINRNVTLA